MKNQVVVDKSLPKNLPLLIKDRAWNYGDYICQRARNKDGKYVSYTYKETYSAIVAFASSTDQAGPITKTIEDYERIYPERNLPEGAIVTRFAPSPTGYMHLGNLYSALISYKLAQQSGGVFILRIENTDTKRENKDAVDIIINSLAEFGITYENDPVYGPYYQSERKDIYHSVAADLLARGLAYPCFLTADDMEQIRENQKAAGFATGIYGEFARDRDLTEEDIIAHLDSGEVPSIRLYSMGNPEQRIFCKDAVRGSIGFPESNEDIVLIKSTDRLPTYTLNEANWWLQVHPS